MSNSNLATVMRHQMQLAHPLPFELIDGEFDYYPAIDPPSMCSQCAKIVPDEDVYCDDCGGRCI